MSRDFRLYLEDILEAATRVRTYLRASRASATSNALRPPVRVRRRVRPRAGSGLLDRVRPGHNAVLDEARRFP